MLIHSLPQAARATCFGVLLSIVVSHGIAKADTISANLYTPPIGPALTVIDLAGILSTPASTDFSAPGYSVTFVSGFPSGQGVVQGATGIYAIPVAGVSGGNPEFLTAGYGSVLTTNNAGSGNYFSTGLGSIVIAFTTPLEYFALLWGSIDTSNSLSFNDAANFDVTGSEVQAAAAGFVSNGYQGPGGSAYVQVHTDTPFTTVTATSGIVSFEFAGVAGSSVPFTAVPEPAAYGCLAGMVFVIGVAAMRQRARVNKRKRARKERAILAIIAANSAPETARSPDAPPSAA